MRWLYGAGRLSGSVLLAAALCSFDMYELDCDERLLTTSERYAMSQIGTMEKKSNRGEVGKYLATVGLGEGYPYCAAGVYWSFSKAVEELGLPQSAVPIKRTAVANEVFNGAKRRGKLVKRDIARHDLIVWKSKNHWSGHIERVLRTKRKGIVETIGFNVKTKGGEGVAMKTRFVNHPLGRLMMRGVVTFKKVKT
ncbi:MAG: hypothetical protein ACE364_07685 [Chlorobiota bacterium]